MISRISVQNGPYTQYVQMVNEGWQTSFDTEIMSPRQY